MMVLFLLLLFSYKIQENVFEIQRNFYDIKNKIHKFILFLLLRNSVLQHVLIFFKIILI